MKSKRRLAIIAGVLIFIISGTGIYVNYQLNHALDQTGIFLQDKDSGAAGSSETKLAEVFGDESGFLNGSEKPAAKTKNSSAASDNNAQLDSSRSKNEIQVADIQKKVGKPIAKQDILKAGLILVRKLSPEELRYLKNVAMQNSYSREEYLQSQKILLNNLSKDDINTLKKLGKKYGSDLEILSPNTKS